MEFIAILSDSLLNGFFLVTILLLLGQLMLPKHRQPINQLIAFSNTLLLIGAITFLFVSIQQVIMQLHTNDEYEKYALINRITGPYWLAYWGAILGKGMLPQVLWVKVLRRSLGASVALLPFLLIDYWLPLLYATSHRDYLPAAWWSMQPNYYGLVVAGVIYLVLLSLLFGITQLSKNK